MYAEIRSWVYGSVPAGAQATDVFIGWAVYILAITVARRPMKSWWSAIIVVIVGLLIAIADMLFAKAGFKQAAREWVFFCVLPVLTTLVARLGWLR